VPRVLLIENEPLVARSLLRLAEACESEVDWAPNPATAYDLAARAPYDVVISDFDLGERESNGVEVVERLRIDLRDSQFVVMSGMPRQVPDWCDFVDKLDTDAFRAAVSPPG
jgi:DNA-binding response OmpR family regulator